VKTLALAALDADDLHQAPTFAQLELPCSDGGVAVHVDVDDGEPRTLDGCAHRPGVAVAKSAASSHVVACGASLGATFDVERYDAITELLDARAACVPCVCTGEGQHVKHVHTTRAVDVVAGGPAQ